jgi:hypothetical protein
VEGIDLETNEEIAIKLQHIGDEMSLLRYEADIYDALSNGLGIPRVHWDGEECEYYVMIHDLLGPSLKGLFQLLQPQILIKDSPVGLHLYKTVGRCLFGCSLFSQITPQLSPILEATCPSSPLIIHRPALIFYLPALFLEPNRPDKDLIHVHILIDS